MKYYHDPDNNLLIMNEYIFVIMVKWFNNAKMRNLPEIEFLNVDNRTRRSRCRRIGFGFSHYDH